LTASVDSFFFPAAFENFSPKKMSSRPRTSFSLTSGSALNVRPKRGSVYG